MIAIIGGGIAGLVAAINLENAGKECTIFEKKDYWGGRVASDEIDGYFLDHGFQVLLTEYPYAQKYLNYEELSLEKFDVGAVLFNKNRKSKFGDPMRDIFNLFPTLFSWAGTLSDKIKVFRLSQELNNKSIRHIFESPEKTTIQYLKDFGFSDKIITHFFKPFFGGIFLEPNLETSSRMFEFVFKMFANGSAAIPSHGMKSIPLQLKGQLRKTKFVTNAEVEILDGELKVNQRAVEVEGIVKAFASIEEWRSCTTLYYKVEMRVLKGKIIGLLTDEGTFINSFHYLSDTVLSATVVKEHQPDTIDKIVREELTKHLGIQNPGLIKKYHIPRSLPILENIGEGDRSNLVIKNQVPVVEAGDHLYYGSLNAAMHSGEVAALALLDALSSGS